VPGRVFGSPDVVPEPEPERPTLRKIGPEARNIFTYQPTEEKKRNVAYNPKKYESSIKFEEEQPVPTPSVKGIKQHSSFSLSGDDASQDHVPSVRSSAPPPRNIFEYQPEEAKTIAINPKKNHSSFTFGAEPVESVASPTSLAAGATQQFSSLSLEEDKKQVQEQPPVEESIPEQPETTNDSANQDVEEKVAPAKSTFVATPMFGQAPEQVKQESFSGRPSSARANESQFSIGGQQTPETPERSFSGRSRSAIANQSSFSFAQPEPEVEHQPAKPMARRDPNASAYSLIGGPVSPPDESIAGTGKRLFRQPENREPEVEKPRVR
jgi:hypothetical protein